ncbi:MAG: ThuA domain-containing protein [Verrucomicrobiota bacterium]
MKRLPFLLLLLALPASLSAATPDGKKKLVIIAGKPSHPPLMHEFRAGSLLLAKSLAGVPDFTVDVQDQGWVKDEATFKDADAVVIYADGGPGHPAIQGEHLAALAALAKRGCGIGFMHYGVEIPAAKGGPEFQQWVGGYYENQYSVNPMWEPRFEKLPVHPVTRGVEPFQIRDEWYFNIRFKTGFTADGTAEAEKMKFTPILTARPSDTVRDGPYVYPAGPYPHIQAEKGRTEAMMWCVERPDGGRGFGFTGGHYHLNWGNSDFRRTVLNALVWVTGAEVPAGGIDSKVSEEDLKENLDPKGKPKPKS